MKKKMIILVILLVVALLFPSLSPDLSIRRIIFLRGNPVKAFTVQIKTGNIYENGNQLYNVSNYHYCCFYVRKSVLGYLVTDFGTGP
ncbi:hypothetical protein DQG23_04775 [Paenibacillus contaminans]|uniref:Uncharacterized protein n=1 Tax=Paenibacillus contaminans TaxID=450362 RepID=A0A329MSK2_9BACL|nr:hypothetical protein DQG23_04775 [Paenibacillus contaminans]